MKLFLLFLLALPSAQDAKPRPALDKYNLPKNHLALEGYDPVAYFPVGGGKPTEGKKSITTVLGGVTYRFATERNRELFLRTPERFEPAYGGWCAYAMASDDRVDVDPESFLIQDGELLLFYDGFWGDTRKKWNKEGPAKLKPKADAAWKEYSKERGRPVDRWNLEQGVALKGYDPVSYFDGKPVPGKPELSLVVRGVTYRFASEASRSKFSADPEAFEPHLGGWCAWAMSEGEKVAADPESFLVRDGALLLFQGNEQRDAFAKEADTREPAARKAWAKLQR